MSLQAMDASHVALVALKLGEGGFSYYRCDHPITIGVSISNLAKVMKLADSSDQITLQTDHEANFMKITFDNQKQSKTTTFNLTSVNVEMENLAIPDTEYSSIVKINSNEFTKICRELAQIDETVIIHTKHDSITFQVDGGVGSGQISLSNNHSSEKKEEQTIFEVTKGVTQQFGLRYLN
jgi:proliferating cell nuclear antigen